jgi:hypothetical protein
MPLNFRLGLWLLVTPDPGLVFVPIPTGPSTEPQPNKALKLGRQSDGESPPYKGVPRDDSGVRAVYRSGNTREGRGTTPVFEARP